MRTTTSGLAFDDSGDGRRDFPLQRGREETVVKPSIARLDVWRGFDPLLRHQAPYALDVELLNRAPSATEDIAPIA